MYIAIIYQSRGGNTKKVADAMARELHTAAWSVEEAKNLDCDLLFLGSGVYAASLDKTMRNFIATLTPHSAKKIVLFGTSAGGRKPFGMMKKLLKLRGLTVEKDFLYIPGSFAFMNRGRPNEDDLASARAFARKVIENLGGQA